MKPNIGIPKKDLHAVTELLNTVLANEVTLYTKTRKFHWNVSGESFMELHKLFQNQYKLGRLRDRTSAASIFFSSIRAKRADKRTGSEACREDCPSVHLIRA